MINIPWGMKWGIIRDTVHLISAGATNENLDTVPVRKGTIQIIHHISVENKTTAYTSLRIGSWSAAVHAVRTEEKSPAAAEVYWMDEQVILGAGERIRAALNGTTSGDKLAMFIEGIWIEV